MRIVAETRIDPQGLQAFLDDIGTPEWFSDGDSDAEVLVEAAGKICYMSFSTDLNKNLTKVGTRTNHQYIQEGLVGTGHLSVLEHSSITLALTDVSRICLNELVRHRPGAAYCLAGDAVVWSGSQVNGRFDGVGRTWTMRELYEKTLTGHGRFRLKLIRVRCFDGHEIVPAKIKSVIYSGKKPIFKVLLANGRSIRSSIDHRFLGEGGWLRVGDLAVGVRLACNGVHWGHTTEAKEKIREGKLGSKNPMWKGSAVGRGGGHIRAQKMYEAKECSKCGSTKGLERHHVDKDPTNNAPSNVEVLCSTCHHAVHAQPIGVYPCWSEVVSITEDGYEDTYDLEVDHPSHNFVANGIVTHNSQTSGRYVRTDNLGFWVPTCIRNNPQLHDLFIREIEHQEVTLRRFEDISGINEMTSREDFPKKKELTSAFRRIIGNGLASNIMATFNHRALRHILTMRTSRHAEEEIRLVFNRVYHLVKERFPALYADAKEEVVDGYLEISFGDQR